MNRRAKFLVGVVVTLMATVISANVILLLRAIGDPSFAVEENYYQRALAWDEAQEARRQSDALGWWTGIEATRHRLVFALRDELGRPIVDARVRVEAFHSARSANRVKADIPHARDGIYALDLGVDRLGLWEYRFVAERGAERYEETKEVNVQ